MGAFFINGPTILNFEINCQSSYIINHISRQKNCLFENWIFKNFVLDIYSSQTDYSNT
jgi:hypothetical protein